MLSLSISGYSDGRNNSRLPSLHAVDDAQVILLSLPASLELVEQETQLHADHQARHAQEDITPYLQ